MRKQVFFLMLLLGMGISIGGLSMVSEDGQNQVRVHPMWVPHELIVRVKEGVMRTQEDFKTLWNQSLDEEAVLSAKSLLMNPKFQKLKLREDVSLTFVLSQLRKNSLVKYVEPNFIYHVMGKRDRALEKVPNDPKFSNLWAMQNMGQKDSSGQVGVKGADIDIMRAWGKGFHGNKKILVAVIDTGIDWEHPDLKANVYTNPGESGEKATNGKDDDHNGLVDDVHGWNFYANSNVSIDDNDHGTHVAGTIGALGNNGKGVVGVNWNVRLLPVKFLGSDGSGSLEGAINAITYARKMKAKIMSNSWGGGGYSEALKEVISDAKKDGILFVAAAGNDGSDNDVRSTYPASYELENVLAVAATDNRDQLASFSNWGRKKVHVAAPGVNILSTIKGGRYDSFSGTSMATPHVSGIAALLWGSVKGMDFRKVKARLIRTSDPIRSLRKKVISKGRINAYQALMNIVPPNPDPDESLWKDIKRKIESPHPYESNKKNEYRIQFKGAKYVRLHFKKIELENRYDLLTIQAPNGGVIEQITGSMQNYFSDYVKGDTLLLKFSTDSSVTKWGFEIDKIQVILK